MLFWVFGGPLWLSFMAEFRHEQNQQAVAAECQELKLSELQNASWDGPNELIYQGKHYDVIERTATSLVVSCDPEEDQLVRERENTSSRQGANPITNWALFTFFSNNTLSITKPALVCWCFRLSHSNIPLSGFSENVWRPPMS